MLTNYLDDFLFTAESANKCNQLVRMFLAICDEIGIPIAMEKTEWAAESVVFLGLLLKGDTFTISIPEVKRVRAVNILNKMCSSRKATVKEIQSLCRTP